MKIFTTSSIQQYVLILYHEFSPGELLVVTEGKCNKPSVPLEPFYLVKKI